MAHGSITLAVLVSGAGTTLQNLIDAINRGELDARIAIVIGSRPGLQALNRATDAGIPTVVVDRRESTDVAAFSSRVFAHVDEAGVDLVCLAGWLCRVEVPWQYEHRVMNIHPSLLPALGGKGMYGLSVHQAALGQGFRVSGCTVHFVDNEYDHGPVILQRVCEVKAADTPESLAARVFELERGAYLEAIRLFANGRLSLSDGRVHVRT
ncbi:MAG: phosphoribosylglycinamide formyltransferase [Tepidisphaeraceae bacterium]